MRDRGPWRLWSPLLLILAGYLYNPVVKCQSYDGARGDSGDGNAAALGFSGVVQRHDGYVKGETPTIPQTSFSCSAQPHNPGLYADVETQCQVYHVCFEDRQESFLCGPGTNFNQRILACDFWYNFDCQASPSFAYVNADIGKVPGKVFNQGQSREPQRPQQPSYPNFPEQHQPPSGGSYPSRVSVPPPPPRPVQPQPPSIQPKEPYQPQQPSIPQEPYKPQPSKIPQEPYKPQPPRIPQEPYKPQPPRIPQEPYKPQPPRIPQEPYQPQPPRVQPPRIHPQPPRVQPQPPIIYPEPPAFKPQPRPDPPHVSIQSQYPRNQQGSGQPGSKVRHPPQQQFTPQQEEDNGYQFDGHNPSRPVVLPPPQQTHSQRPRPEFPPVVSPPRISRPPLTPPIIRQPEIPRVSVIDTRRTEYHPDAHLKGNVGYRPPQQSRIPQPSIDYPSYPVSQRPAPRPVPQRPIEKPSRPTYKPPQTVQQEHVDTEYVPPPPPPTEFSRPSTTYVPPPPPPPPPVQHEVTNIDFPKTPQQPARPYVPPPVAQKPVEPQPPVSPSIIREHQKPAYPPPSRPQIHDGARQPPPQRPKPVFPPASDHPNSNIKGGPGYNQPPPQIPRFEPTRINPPSIPHVHTSSGSSSTAVKSNTGKTPTASGQGTYKPPQQRVKKPSDPPRTVYQPPIQVIDHPRAEIKGVAYEPVIQQQPQRVQSPSSPISGIKRPVERPRAPVVVSRPQPPSLPTSSIKKTSPVDSQVYEKPRPQPPTSSRVKQPSTNQIHNVPRPSQPRFPVHDVIDHPNANVKGTPGYQQQIQPIGVSRPFGPPSSPATSYEQKTTSSHPGHSSGSGYLPPPRGDTGHIQQVIQQEYKPSRSSPPSSIKTVSKINTAVKDTGNYQPPPVGSQHSVLINKQGKPNYQGDSSYTRGQDIYPKPEFGKPNAPYQPVSTPSRHSPATKQGLPSQNTITRSQNKPATSGQSNAIGSAGSRGPGSDLRPDYPFNQVPGHQPPHERQVFPHRENPDHPNESLKGSGAYRPPPPAGFQAAASEVQEQKVEVPEAEPAAESSLHGDTGSE